MSFAETIKKETEAANRRLKNWKNPPDKHPLTDAIMALGLSQKGSESVCGLLAAAGADIKGLPESLKNERFGSEFEFRAGMVFALTEPFDGVPMGTPILALNRIEQDGYNLWCFDSMEGWMLLEEEELDWSDDSYKIMRPVTKKEISFILDHLDDLKEELLEAFYKEGF